MDVINLIPNIYAKFSVFVLIFTRISTLLSIFFLFRREIVTSRIVLSISVVLSMYVLLANPTAADYQDVMSLQMLLQMFLQSFIGIIGGLILNIVIEVFLTLGQIISAQIGLSTASLIDQRFGYITSLSQFYVITATLLFLLLNGHLFVFKTIVDSFTIFPIYQTTIPTHLIKNVLEYSSVIFSGSIMLSITLMIIVFISNIALSVMSKFAPQFNLFTIGISMQLIIGLFCVYITYQLLIDSGRNYIGQCLKVFSNTIMGVT